MKKILIFFCSLIISLCLFGCQSPSCDPEYFYVPEPRLYESLLSNIYIFEIVECELFEDVISEKQVDLGNTSYKPTYIYTLKIKKCFNEQIYDNMSTYKPYRLIDGSYEELSEEYRVLEGREYKMEFYDNCGYELFQQCKSFIGKILPIYSSITIEGYDYLLTNSLWILDRVFPLKDDKIDYDGMTIKDIPITNYYNSYDDYIKFINNPKQVYEEDGTLFFNILSHSYIFRPLFVLNNYIDDEIYKIRNGMTLEQFEVWLNLVKQAQNEFYGYNIYEKYPTIEERYVSKYEDHNDQSAYFR